MTTGQIASRRDAEAREGARRRRVLFVISQLIQNGAERWLFEVARALDPSRFQVEILTSPWVRGARHHYLEPIRRAGIPLHRKLPWSHPLLVRAGLGTGRMERSWRWMGAANRLRPLGRWMQAYDLVCPVQVENYYAIQGLVEPARCVVHLMSNRIQHDEDPLVLLREGPHPALVVAFNEAQRAELGVVPARTAVWPLSMALSGRPALDLPHKPLRIGVVTRLSSQKPLDPLLYAYRELLARRPDAELHIFGGGDPEIYGRTLDLLGLRSRARFRGHAVDLVGALHDNDIALCWMLSVGEAVGYASIEIASVGVPVLCWDLLGRGGMDPVESFTTPGALADRTARLLGDREALQAEGRRQRAHFLDKHDVQRTIGALEALYHEVLSPR